MHRLLGAFPETPPAANRTRPHVVGSEDGGNASFDTNMVIILAALLCALVLALGLNSAVRCALRWGRRLAAIGLKRRALRRLPVSVYGAGADVPATECPICLGEFADGEKVRVLPGCRHGFHVGCIDRWLASHSSCPTCRRSLLDHSSRDAAEMSGRAQDGAAAAVVVADMVS